MLKDSNIYETLLRKTSERWNKPRVISVTCRMSRQVPNLSGRWRQFGKEGVPDSKHPCQPGDPRRDDRYESFPG
jgi:hypothetical protein